MSSSGNPRSFWTSTAGGKFTAPLTALTMATLLFIYTRTSIRAAKRNAQAHREADGGQISWHKESLRSHGVLERPGEQGSVKELGREMLGVGVAPVDKDHKGNGKVVGKETETDEERRIREVVRRGGRED